MNMLIIGKQRKDDLLPRLEFDEFADGEGFVLADGFFGDEAEASGPKAVEAGGNWGGAGADHVDALGDFGAEFEDFAAVGFDIDLGEIIAVEDFEEVFGFEGAVEGAAPAGPKGSFGAADFNGLMVLEGGEGLGDDGVAAIGVFEHGAEVVEEGRTLGVARVAVGVEFDGVAAGFEVPAGKVKKVNGFFKHPGADAILVIAPTGGSLPIGLAGEFDEDVLRISDGAGVDDVFDFPPLRGEAEFVANGEVDVVLASGGDDGLAVIEGDGHGFFQQDVFAFGDRCQGDVAMGVAGRGDVYEIEVGLGDHVLRVGEDLGLRIELAGFGAGGFGWSSDGDE